MGFLYKCRSYILCGMHAVRVSEWNECETRLREHTQSQWHSILLLLIHAIFLFFFPIKFQTNKTLRTQHWTIGRKEKIMLRFIISFVPNDDYESWKYHWHGVAAATTTATVTAAKHLIACSVKLKSAYRGIHKSTLKVKKKSRRRWWKKERCIISYCLASFA